MNSNLTIDGIDDVAAHFGDFRGQLRVLLPILQIQDVAAALNFFYFQKPYPFFNLLCTFFKNIFYLQNPHHERFCHADNARIRRVRMRN